MIRYFAAHPTAANLLMAAFVLVGAVSLPKLLRETFPRIAARQVQVEVPYPGAAPAEVARALCQRIEDAVDGIQNVDEVRCEARENVGVAVVEMAQGEDLAQFFLDVQTAIEAIDDFPGTAEKPVVTQLGRADFVASVALSGPRDRTELEALARAVKQRMLAWGGIPRVEVTGFSAREIRIEVPAAAARELGLGLQDIAGAIARQNVDLPGGEITARDGVVVLRFADQRLALDAYRDLVIVSSPRGGQIRLGDVASIRSDFVDEAVRFRLNDEPAALLDVTKTPKEDTLRVMARVRAFVEAERATLPPGVTVKITADGSQVLVDRLQMLVTNGWQGLALVIIAIWLFFGLRQALWIGLGLPVSFLGALAAMTFIGYSINMLTMVGLLIVIGILMDDAIVIAENVATMREEGLGPLEAAVAGTAQVGPGVIASFITTVAVFGSLAFLEGDIGEVLRVIPVVMVLVLVVSLFEAFLILPNHLAHGGCEDPGAVQRAAARAVEWARTRVVGPAARLAVDYRYLTLGLGALLFLASVALLAGGVVKFQAFPEIDGDLLEARIELVASAPRSDTEAAVAAVVAALARVERALSPNRRLVRDVVVRFGENPDAGTSGAFLATVKVDLQTGAVPRLGNAAILAAWRTETPKLSGLRRLNLTEAALGPAGRAIELRLSHDDLRVLARAAGELEAWLARYAGAYNLADDLAVGKPELRLSMREGAGSLGLDARAVAEQVRAAFHGISADEIQIGGARHEVNVRLADVDRDGLGDLDHFTVNSPAGARVPLDAVAEIAADRGFTRINRIDRRPTVTVTGDVDTTRANASEIVGDTERRFLPELRRRYPGLSAGTEGQNAEAARTQASMGSGLVLGLVAVYLLLGFQFRAYAEPIAVMAIIPFALIGAVLGHLVMGIDLSMPSVLGLVSLVGIVVNDSILLVNFIKDEHAPGAVTVADAAPAGAEARFRAILLTSVTTVAGVFPLLFETSPQAQVLTPLVTSIAFGLMSTTILITFVVPAFYTILDDLGLTSLAAERRRAQRAHPAGAEPA